VKIEGFMEINMKSLVYCPRLEWTFGELLMWLFCIRRSGGDSCELLAGTLLSPES
jgi:hypothetical protein